MITTFWDIPNITNAALIVLSLATIAWCVYCITKGKKHKLCYFGIALALVVGTLCIRASYKNYRIYDLYNKVIRPTKSYYLNELTLSTQACREDFEEITDIVQKYYAPIARHKQIDLQGLKAEYKEKVATVENAQQYGLLLLRYFAELQNMHTYPFFSEYVSGVSLVSRNDSVWVKKNHDKRVDLQPKDLIVAVNGITTKDYILNRMCYTWGSIESCRRECAAIKILSSYTESCKRVTVLRGDSILDRLVPLYKEDEVIERLRSQTEESDSLQQLREKKSIQQFNMANVLKKKEDIGYLSLSNFTHRSVEDFCWLATSEFTYSYLILDLQKNLGGRKGYMLQIASRLITRPTVMGGQTIESDSSECYRGKLFVLVDEFTSSAGEALAALLKEEPEAVVIGRRTAGDCGSNGCNFKTSHGLEFKLATKLPYLLPDGVTWSEGEGIAPDIAVEKVLPWEHKKDAFQTALELIEEDKLTKNRDCDEN